MTLAATVTQAGTVTLAATVTQAGTVTQAATVTLAATGIDTPIGHGMLLTGQPSIDRQLQ